MNSNRFWPIFVQFCFQNSPSQSIERKGVSQPQSEIPYDKNHGIIMVGLRFPYWLGSRGFVILLDYLLTFSLCDSLNVRIACFEFGITHNINRRKIPHGKWCFNPFIIRFCVYEWAYWNEKKKTKKIKIKIRIQKLKEKVNLADIVHYTLYIHIIWCGSVLNSTINYYQLQ